MTGWVARNSQKIRDIGLGLFLWESWNFGYDYIFYPFALAYWGLLIGGTIVVVFSFTINAFVFWLYEYMRVDWLAANALRELEDEENKSNIAKLATWIGKKKTTLWEKIMSPVVFVGLLLPIDPVIVAIHFQRSHFKGLGWKDWGIFALATAVANAWWLIKIGFIVETAFFVWHLFF